MHVGLSVTFQNPLERRADADVYHHELGFALQAEMWGFDSVWTGEHHFTGYGICPDPLQLLTYLAGQTRHIQLGTDALVLPRNDPIRLAEQVTLLDNLSAGRLLLGIGQGMAVGEQENFVEQARALVATLESPGELRPRPERSLRGRTYAADVSPASMPAMAELGAGLLIPGHRAWEMVKGELDRYSEAWWAVNEGDPPPPFCSGLVLVDEDPDRAEALARQHLGEHHGAFRRHHLEEGVPYEDLEHIVDVMPWGTPDGVLDKLASLREVTGMDGFTANLCFGGMSYEEAERNIACFVDQVLPAVKSWL